MDEDIKKRLKKELEDREVFRRVFGGREGGGVLTWILNECGLFSLEKAAVEPCLIAFGNRLLNRIGVVHGMNLFEDTAARLGAAGDADIKTYLKEETETDE
jgi:hypothetical protein